MDFKIKVERIIKDEDVSSLLTSAFEGGSNYWYMIEKKVNAKADKAFEYACDIVLKGHGLVVSDACEAPKEEVRKAVLDRTKCQIGLQIMAEKEPRHFGNIMTDECDAITGDVFLQCCLFGEVIYG